MRLSKHAFTRLWDVHAWVGVLGGLVLHLMFLTGAITLFHPQLGVWQEPLAQKIEAQGNLQLLLERTIRASDEPLEDFWLFLPGKELPVARLGNDPAGEVPYSLYLIEETGLVKLRERLADFIYELHYLWHEAIPQLYTAAGFISISFLLALVTGVLIHLKDLVAQFHQFRPEEKPRVVWSDLHKVLGVIGLPFQAFFAYSGALIILTPLILNAYLGPVFGGDQKRADLHAWGIVEPEPSPPGAAIGALSLDELLERAQVFEPGFHPDRIRLYRPGFAGGFVEFRGPTSSLAFGEAVVRLSPADGALLAHRSPKTEGAFGAVQRWIYGVHFAHFGGAPLRVLFALLALATSATILSGNLIWLERRDRKRASRGNRILARATIGVGIGSFLALAALFVVSRILPLDLPKRGTIEELCFVFALAAALGWALFARDERTVLTRQLACSGLLLLPVPLLATRWSGAGLFGGDSSIPAVVGVELALLAIGVILLCVARALRRR